jgi:hypothetical protein
MQFFAITNHMHAYGTSVYTEVIHANGSKATIVDNRTDWTSDMEFNPKYAVWPATALLSINKGDTVHTHCEWTNTTGKAMQFPDEMCVAAGFNMTPGAGVNCIDAQWP